MAFLTEDVPAYGVPVTVAPGVRRIVARNPGRMTYHGTNTYPLDGADGVSVLDPGPDDADHLAAVLAAAGKVARIIVTHSHHDHVGNLAALRATTAAPVYAQAPQLSPDHVLADGDEVAGWRLLHTPGHAADHFCLARADGVLMTADHVMGWSTSVVSPPEGDMAAYFASLRRLLAREDAVYLPGHGPAIDTPRAYAQFLLDHRQGREDAILAVLGHGAADIETLVAALYVGLAEALVPMAKRNVLAHLQKLAVEERAVEDGAVWVIRAPSFGRAS